MKFRTAIFFSLVVLFAVYPLAGKGAAQEVPYAADIPLTPNVRPAVVVSGADYDMGYQWYQQLAQIYGKQPLLERANREFSKDELDALKAWEWFIKKHTPYMIDLLKGMVAGAKDAGIPLTYEEILAKWASHEFLVPPVKAKEKLPKDILSRNDITDSAGCRRCEREEGDCSGWAAWGSTTKDGKLIAGGSGDHEIIMGENEIQDFEYMLLMMPKEGNNFILSTSTGCCWHPAMNNKGVVMFHHGTTGYCGRYKTPEQQDYGYGVPNVMITMHVIRNAKTALEAQQLMLSLPSGDGRVGGAWADIYGTAFVIENRDNPRSIRKPGDNGEKDFIYSTNNLLSKELGNCYQESPGKPVEFVEHAGWLGHIGASFASIARNLGLWNTLHNYSGHVDLDFAKMMWRFAPDPAPRYTSFEQADIDYAEKQGRTWNSNISEQGNAMVGILMPENGDTGRIMISQGTVARVNYPHFPGGRVPRIAPTYTFYELQLDATPQKVVQDCRNRARYELSYADRELRKLTYRDVAYDPLNKLYNEAATEWQKGQYYLSRAGATQGNESVLFLAKATRAFSRTQALAKQVFETLVPPPTRPEDLGLKPWLGAWGDWGKRQGTPRSQVKP